MIQPRTALVELHYLPPVQYMTLFLAFDRVRLEQHEHYQKGGYRNRCHIAGPNGRQLLSVPLHKGKNEQQPIREVRINHAEDWRRQHWRSITTAYNNSPFFLFYADELHPFFERRYTFLFDLNRDLLYTLLRLLHMPPALEWSHAFDARPEAGVLDLRHNIRPNTRRQQAASWFRPAPYPQVFEEKNGFLPNLSILDLLFCCGPQAVRYLEDSIVHA